MPYTSLKQGLLLIALSVAVAGCQTTTETKPADSSSVKLSSQVFLDMMNSAMPRALCVDNPAFRQCLNVSEQRCMNEVKEAAPACSQELLKTMPAYLQSKSDGEKYGRMMGECVAGKIVFSGRYDYKQLQNCKGMK